MEIQRISLAGTDMVLLTADDFDRLVAAAEDVLDVAEAKEALAEAKREGMIPGAVVDAILDGKHPIVAWREYRGMSQADLARAAGFTQPAINRLERVAPGAGRPETIDAIAKALGAPRSSILGD